MLAERKAELSVWSQKLNQSTNQSIIIASIERDGAHDMLYPQFDSLDAPHHVAMILRMNHAIMNHDLVVNQHSGRSITVALLLRTDQFESNNQRNCNGHICSCSLCHSLVLSERKTVWAGAVHTQHNETASYRAYCAPRLLILLSSLWPVWQCERARGFMRLSLVCILRTTENNL